MAPLLSPATGAVFFIDYASLDPAPTSVADDRLNREHPNGARELSAFWLLSSHADSDRKQLERMGFAGALPVRVPRLSARGYCIPIGPNGLIVLEPDGAGIAADALRNGGSQILGVSVGVTDLDRAKRWVERGYEQQVARYKGVFGDSFLAPTGDDLGIFIEFHALKHAGGSRACGGRVAGA